MSNRIKPGMRIRDNDKRTGNRVLVVDLLLSRDHNNRAVFLCQLEGIGGHATRIREDRIYTDGKPRKSGFSLIKGEQGE